MTDETPDLNQRLAARVRELRAASGLSLEALASASGVSRSMISLIERGESSPTAVVLEKLAAALGVTLASLFEGSAAEAARPVSRRAAQAEWRDPASGYRRRHVSPDAARGAAQLVEVEFPAGARVAFEVGARDVRVTQQVWILEGTMDITLGDERHRLEAGDCLVMHLDCHTMFHNPTAVPARYVVVLHTDPASRH